jgi:serine/threonine-protein kinase
MEYVEGVDLKQVLKGQGALPPDRAYEVAIQVAEGLQAVHDAGIVHRDLKTPNIMRDASGITRLMDFGVAKRVGEGAATVTGNIVGTPEYMSPEQAQGHKVDTRSDIYALGIVIYEIFTGHVPFRGETPISTILKHLNDPPPLDGPMASRLPASLKPVLRRCLSKDPADRYPTAREVGEALREAQHPSRRQQPMATEVLQAPTMPRGTPPPTRSRFMQQPWLLAIPVVAAAAAFALWARRPAEPVAVVQASPAPSLAPATVAAAVPVAPTPTVPAVPVDAPPAIAVPAPTLAARPTPRPNPFAVRPPATHAPAPPPTTMAAAPVPVTTLAPAPTTTVPAAPAGPGMLQMVVKPWGEVTIDGRMVGTTPLDRISLSAGTHAVSVRHPLYEQWDGRVTIRPGQTERVVVDFPSAGRRRQP